MAYNLIKSPRLTIFTAFNIQAPQVLVQQLCNIGPVALAILPFASSDSLLGPESRQVPENPDNSRKESRQSPTMAITAHDGETFHELVLLAHKINGVN
jgi:hypothetical protein